MLKNIAPLLIALKEELEQHDIVAENMNPGVCSISVPQDLDDEQLTTIAEQLGAQLVVQNNAQN